MKAIVIILAILPYCSSGQNLYIGPNQSATTIQASYYSTQSSVSAQGLEIGRSVGGMLDVGLQIGLGRLDSYYNTVFGGLSTSLYLLKPDNIDGGIIFLEGGYRRLSMRIKPNYDGNWLDFLHGNIFEFAGTAGSRIQASTMLTLLPLITIGARNTSNELYSESALFYGFGLSWLIRTGSLTQFVVTPSISISEDVGRLSRSSLVDRSF